MTALSDEQQAAAHSSEQEPKRSGVMTAVGRWAAVVVVLAFVAVLAFGLRYRNASQPTEGTIAPDFTLPLFSGYEADLGSEVQLASLRGKVVVINFWASWCITCRDEQIFLEQAWQRYKDKGVVFLGVDYVDTEPAARQYLQEFKVTYPNGPDIQTRISPLYRIRGVPETFVVDKSGTIVMFHPAPFSDRVSQSEFIATIEKALEE